MWNLAEKNIREICRDKKLLTISLFFPVLLLLVSHLILNHAAAYTENLPLAVVNPEPHFPHAGELLVVALRRAVSGRTEHPLYAVSELDRNEALQALEKGKVTGVLLIPRGFTAKLNAKTKERLILILNQADPRSGILIASLSGLIDHFGRLVLMTQGMNRESPVSLSTVSRGQSILSPERLSLANVTLFAFLFLIPYAAGQCVSEFEHGSLMRFKLAQVPPAQVFGGIIFSTAFLAGLQAALLLACAFLLGLHPHPLMLWIWPLGLILLLAAAGLGFFLAAFVEKEKHLQLVSSIILVLLYLLSSSVGKELVDAKWSAFLPWPPAFSMLMQVLGDETPRMLPFMEMTAASLFLAIAGTTAFSMKRLRDG